MSQNFFKHFFREGHHDFFGDALVWMNGWMDGWMDGQMDKWMDGWMDVCMD